MFKKISLVLLVTVFSIATLPSSSVYASGLSDETTPPEKTKLSGERLEELWVRVLKINEGTSKKFENLENFRAKIQIIIDKASENGNDTLAVQAALDAFSASVEEARPIFEGAQAFIVNPNVKTTK
ncbi:MAG: hypothetical protein HN392_00290 [Anaerolineae bacterium]|nr:hypothetical protein [Anaerolineae bacterium]MBT7075650.1 hypothetical protein [Anaerolineae bacterium]